jgi:PAS domain S-box-containing protein
MMPDNAIPPQYPILDEIAVPEPVIANWQITVDLLAEIARVPAALIMRVHAHDIEVFVASHSAGNVYHPGEKAPLNTGLYCETVMRTQCKLLVPNALTDPDWAHNPDITLDMISYCGLPLTWPNGELFGTICILDKKENAYSPRTHQLLERLRDSIQLSLANIYTTSLAHMQREETITRLRTVLEAIPIGVLILDAASQMVQSNGQAERIYSGAVSLPEPLQEYRRGRAWWTATGQTVEDDDWPSAQALRQGAIVTDQEIDILRADGACANTLETAAPLREAQGKITGAVVVVQDITERKLAEDALRTAEANYRVLFDSMMDAYVKVDMAGHLLDYNPAYQAMVGYTADELRHLTYTDLTPESWHAMEAHIITEQILPRGYSDVYEKEYRRNDGVIFPVELRTFLLRDTNGQPSAMWAIVRDITERKQAEQTLQENQRQLNERNQQLEGLFASAPAGMALFAAAYPFQVLVHNRVYQEFWAEPFHSQGMVGKYITDYAPLAEESGIFAVFQDVAATGQAKTLYDFPYEGLPRGKTWWNWSLTPVYQDGQLVAFAHMLIEVTPQFQARQALEAEIGERQRAEEAVRTLNAELEQRVRERTAELEEGRRILEALMTYIPEGITIADAPDVMIRMVSQYGQALTGKPHEVLEGIPSEEHVEVWDLFKADGLTRPAGDELPLTRAVKQGEVVNDEVWVLRQPSGHEITILCNAGPIRDQHDNIVGGIIAWRDVTERIRAEDELKRVTSSLQQQTALLEAANKEMEAFTYSVSHDLRAPLRAVDGFSKAILEDYTDKLDEEGREDLGFIRAGAQQMGKLIDDMLRLSRVGRAEMRVELVDVSALVRAIADDLQRQDPVRQVAWQITPGLSAWGDQSLLQIMLENLLSNAWKFTGKSTTAQIAFFATTQDGDTVYAIRDNGAGFDMAYVNKLFAPFQRLHTAEEFPGTGIGLAIVQRIIARHGGRVWAEGAVNQGATLYFTLPARKEE